ncbi:Copper Transporter integral membrane protein that functions in high affinity copper transport [Arachnomyces sp. PD_36]|nr:Copper Transporter integral membrane protein that functions in high affinity copper transport [Arachnomyces sp. PD_36]
MDMDMDMGSTATMNHESMMHMTTTASAAMASATDMAMDGMAGMDHSSHGGMDMGESAGCKVSMLWNWYTIDACFLDESWQITSNGMFAGSCIGVICLVIVLEFLRRVGREYDAYIVRRHNIHQQIRANSGSSSSSSPKQPTTTTTNPASSSNGLLALFSSGTGNLSNGQVRPTLFDQLIRALLHMLQFAVAYFIMLLAMYYNGYIIICIFIGAFIGSFIFSWEPLGGQGEEGKE